MEAPTRSSVLFYPPSHLQLLQYAHQLFSVADVSVSATATHFWQQLATRSPTWALVPSALLVSEAPWSVTARQAYGATQFVGYCTETDPALRACLGQLTMGQLAAVCLPQEITACLHSMLHGQYFLSSVLATDFREASKSEEEPAPIQCIASISRAEQRVLREMLTGKSSREIATSLFVSARTVDNHKTSIVRKLQLVRTPYSLTKYVLSNRPALLKLLAVN